MDRTPTTVTLMAAEWVDEPNMEPGGFTKRRPITVTRETEACIGVLSYWEPKNWKAIWPNAKESELPMLAAMKYATTQASTREDVAILRDLMGKTE